MTYPMTNWIIFPAHICSGVDIFFKTKNTTYSFRKLLSWFLSQSDGLEIYFVLLDIFKPEIHKELVTVK